MITQFFNKIFIIGQIKIFSKFLDLPEFDIKTITSQFRINYIEEISINSHAKRTKIYIQRFSYKNTLHNYFFGICQNSMKPLYKDIENLKNQLNFNFLSNNVKGLQSTKKRLKLFNFLKNTLGP